MCKILKTLRQCRIKSKPKQDNSENIHREKKRILEAPAPAVFYQQTVQDVKYVGVILDVKLLWKKHSERVNTKATKVSLITRQAGDKNQIWYT